MLLSMGKPEQIEEDERWIYDVKWDGWRILLHKEGDKIQAYTREGNQVTHKFPELKELATSIQSNRAIIDCEGVVLRNGNSVFEDFAYRGLLNDPAKIATAMVTHPVTFVAFDVLETEQSHIKEPLTNRKERLLDLISPSNIILPTPSVIADGNHLYDITRERNMEGIVQKKADSTYQVNVRSKDWIKHKHFKLIDAIILGYKENPFALIVGSKFGEQIKPVATVEFGFKPEEKQAFRRIAGQLVTQEQKGIKWLEPVLCCRVQYLEKTEKNHLRIVSFKGFNFEKKIDDCRWIS